MLECRDVSVAFGGRPVLAGCGLALGPGDRLALMGPSGCGKTTLLRVLLGLQRPDSGTVRNGFRRVGAVFQEPRLLPWCSAEENIRAVLPEGPEAAAEARRLLELTELSDAAAKYPDELSGGMQQRVSVARALAVRPELLVLDEAFKGLDTALRDRMLQLADTETRGRNGALLLATHSEEEAEALGCTVLRYREGSFRQE